MSEEKFSKCGEGVKKKNYKCGISGVRKKRIGRRVFFEEKKSKCFSWKLKVKIFVVIKES